jgi:Peptidase family M28
MRKIFWVCFGTLFLLVACHSGQQNNNTETSSNDLINPNITVPSFNADSAYAYVAKQVAFGPRIPGTAAQKNCGDWLISKMKEYADTVYVQSTTLTAWNGKQLPCHNIMAVFNPKDKDRILMLAHWDTRPFSDEDPNKANHNKPFDGADDGGSGVGVLLEVARELHLKKPGIGIDLLLVDDEDYGNDTIPHSFCIGTQYWAKHPPISDYTADYGILLDMVGDKNATFLMEGTSKQYAAAPMKMFWDVANQLGYSAFFRYDNTSDAIEDDHTYINTMAHIPTFDVISLHDNPQSPFPYFWHTQQDNMSIISKSTLKAVGQTLLQVAYTNPPY